MKHVLSTLALAAPLLLAATGSQADNTRYTATLSGPAEQPPNASPGTGMAIIDIDNDTLSMILRVSFSNLLGTTSASHIHCCTSAPLTGTAGVATQVPSFEGFPLGVMAGLYERTFDLSDEGFYNPAFLAANGGSAETAADAFISGIEGNLSYLNIHTSTYPGGEIRGFIVPIPEPGSWAMMGAGLIGLAFCYRRRAAQGGAA